MRVRPRRCRTRSGHPCPQTRILQIYLEVLQSSVFSYTVHTRCLEVLSWKTIQRIRVRLYERAVEISKERIAFARSLRQGAVAAHAYDMLASCLTNYSLALDRIGRLDDALKECKDRDLSVQTHRTQTRCCSGALEPWTHTLLEGQVAGITWG